MATTSPDNIWTPDSGDDYALTVDLAATADTIQDALTDVRSDITTLEGTLVGSGVGLRTSTPHITSGTAYTPVAIAWNIEDFDTANYHAAGTPSRMTIPVSGLYRVSAKVRSASTSFAAGLQFGINGTVDATTQMVSTANPSAGSFSSLTKTYNLTAGQYVEVFSLGQAASLTLDVAACFAEVIRVR